MSRKEKTDKNKEFLEFLSSKKTNVLITRHPYLVFTGLLYIGMSSIGYIYGYLMLQHFDLKLSDYLEAKDIFTLFLRIPYEDMALVISSSAVLFGAVFGILKRKRNRYIGGILEAIEPDKEKVNKLFERSIDIYSPRKNIFTYLSFTFTLGIVIFFGIYEYANIIKDLILLLNKDVGTPGIPFSLLSNKCMVIYVALCLLSMQCFINIWILWHIKSSLHSLVDNYLKGYELKNKEVRERLKEQLEKLKVFPLCDNDNGWDVSAIAISALIIFSTFVNFFLAKDDNKALINEYLDKNIHERSLEISHKYPNIRLEVRSRAKEQKEKKGRLMLGTSKFFFLHNNESNQLIVVPTTSILSFSIERAP